MYQRDNHTKCSGLQFLLDRVLREKVHETPVVKNPTNGHRQQLLFTWELATWELALGFLLHA